MSKDLRSNGRIGWQWAATGAAEKGDLSPAEVIVHLEGEIVTSIVVEYRYDNGSRVLTLEPFDDLEWGFTGSVVEPGRRAFRNLVIHCNLYTHPNGERMLFGNWSEQGDYIWWVHWKSA